MKANEFDSVFQKSYFQLTEEEKLDMKDLFTNEDEFNQAKVMLHSVHQMLNDEQETPVSESVKMRLDDLYTTTYRNKGILWYNSIGSFFVASDKQWHQQNLVRIAAVLLVVFATVPFWNMEKSIDRKQLSFENKQNEQTPVSETDSSVERLKEEEKVTIKKTDENYQLATITTDIPSDNFAPMAAAEDKDKAVLVEKNMADEIPAAVSTHPDGIFMGVTNFQNASFSVSKHTDVLDILTATY